MPKVQEKPSSPMRYFVVLAYLLTWALLAPWFYLFNVTFHGEAPLWLWLIAPLAFVGGWGPTAAALVVTARTAPPGAVPRLLASLGSWRVPGRWYVFVFLLPPLATAVSLLIADRGFTTFRHFNVGAALANVPLAYAIALPFGPLGEELGWRGFALPRLLARFRPWAATLILGALWTFWHVPMMLWMPGASMPSFMDLSLVSVLIYLIQITAETAVMTYLFLRTNGSVLLAVLAHLTFNTAESVIFGGLPRVDDEQLRTVYLVNVSVLAVLGLACLVRVNRRPPISAAA